MGNVLGDPFMLATISISMVSPSSRRATGAPTHNGAHGPFCASFLWLLC